MTDVEHTACPQCGEYALRIEMRLRARPIGSFSLSGHTLKFSADRWPYLVCGACGIAAPAKDE